MKEDMQFVVPFEGGPLHARQILWSRDIYYSKEFGVYYRTVYSGIAKVPEKYIPMEPLASTDTLSSSKPNLILNVPQEIYNLEPARRDKILFQLQNFVQSAVSKYVKGQQEHGGKLEDRPCFDEMHNELLDLMWYWYAEKERRDKEVLDRS